MDGLPGIAIVEKVSSARLNPPTPQVKKSKKALVSVHSELFKSEVNREVSQEASTKHNFHVEIYRPKPLLHYDPSLAAKYTLDTDDHDTTFESMVGTAVWCFG